MAVRVAYLLGTYPSSSETFLARELAAVAQHGIELRLAALQTGGAPLPGVRYRSSSPTPVSVDPRLAARLLTGDGRLSDGGWATPALRLRWLRNVAFAAELAAWCRAEGCHLLHAAWSGLPAQIAWMARQLGGPPYTVAAHAHDVFCPAEALHTALAGARGITCCNRAAAQVLAARGPWRGRLAWLPHGLDLGEWSAREGEPDGPAHVVAVGRLVRKKGFDTLLAAAAKLPEVRVTIVGDGPERAALARQAAGVGERVVLTGQLAPAEVRAALRAATVLALPSRVDAAGDRDGLANVLLEALATGLPVVTTRAGSAADAVHDGRTGLLVPPDDAPALAGALRHLAQDRSLRMQLAAAGRRLVEERFDLERNGAAMARWLARLAEGT